MIQYLHAPRPHKSGIDDLSLFEQEVNAMNGPVILLQLLRILDLHPLRPLFRSIVARFLDCTCLALWASGLWLHYAMLQNLIPSFFWTEPGWRVGSNYAIW